METFYQITCWLHNRKGSSYIVELREKDDNFILRRQDEENDTIEEIRKNGRIDSKKTFVEKTVSQALVKELLDKLNQTKAFLVPRITGGFDGVNYHVRIKNGESLAHYSWWLDCPEDWAALQKFWENIVELSKDT
ncbi:MAG: hypothetical protein KME63_09415 [Candidatus Thiodiazotropha sp. (ex Clathrolucina costata)]|nr:hypothetical protein [Candidatus Thiodiazotropha taylori]MCG7864303.1 hypothetical protein [Candidatus Thiodiazotropha endolucinida]